MLWWLISHAPSINIHLCGICWWFLSHYYQHAWFRYLGCFASWGDKVWGIHGDIWTRNDLWYNYPQDEGFARRAKPEGSPSNHQTIRKINLISIRVWLNLRLTQVMKSPGFMEQFAILLLGLRLELRVYIIHYQIRWPQGTINHTRVSFRAYISQKKNGKGQHAWSQQRVHFPDIFSWKFNVEHSFPKMCQSHKTLRLRSEMSLLKMQVIPFRANPQSCPYNYYRSQIS